VTVQPLNNEQVSDAYNAANKEPEVRVTSI